MGFYGDKKLVHVKWFHNMSLTLAKDIAFNWDKYSGFREREVLFENMLKYCCEISMDTWLEQILESLDSDFVHITETNLIDHLPNSGLRLESLQWDMSPITNTILNGLKVNFHRMFMPYFLIKKFHTLIINRTEFILESL